MVNSVEKENLKQQSEWKHKNTGYCRKLTQRKEIKQWELIVKYHSRVTTWSLGFPLNSGFTLCSKSHITNPVNIKNAPVVHHMSGVKGSRNAQTLLDSFALIGTTITRPDSVYGCVKSTYLLKQCRSVHTDKVGWSKKWLKMLLNSRLWNFQIRRNKLISNG